MTADDSGVGAGGVGPERDKGFRGLSALIYDPKVRGVIYQALLIVFGIIFVIWIINNANDNLPQETSFRFVGEQSGVAIQTSAGTYLMDYVSSKSTVLDVFFVGLINTVIVAILGIFFATIVGFILGIFRLSSNVVLRSFATLYVELFRNIPLILQMIIIYTLVGELLPRAREGGIAIFGDVSIDKGGLRAAFPETLPGGGAVWIVLIGFALLWWALDRWSRTRKDRTGRGFPAFWIAVVGLLVVSPLAYWQAGYLSADNAARWYESDFEGRDRVRDDPRFRDQRSRMQFPNSATVTAVVECAPVVEGGRPVRVAQVDGLVVRGEPVTEILLGRYHADRDALSDYDVASADCAEPEWISPVQWELPLKGGLDGYFPGYGFIFPLSMFAVWLALTIYTAAFIAEIVRSGVLAVNKGQTEAASALGLRASQTRRLVVVPQAMRVVIPPLASQYLNLTKNSSLATVATYPDLVGIFGKTMLNQTGRAIEIVFITMMVYLTLSILISLFMNWYNKRIALVER